MSVARSFVRLQVRIETIAENHSVSGRTGVGLGDTLSALTPKGRSRVAILLERTMALSEDPDERSAADGIMQTAERIWIRQSADNSPTVLNQGRVRTVDG